MTFQNENTKRHLKQKNSQFLLKKSVGDTDSLKSNDNFKYRLCLSQIHIFDKKIRITYYSNLNKLLII